jgi:L-iditol 2-dehydrogenase
MKALVYEGNHSLAIREVEEPTVGDHDALIRVHSVGICGSDLHAYHGHDERRPPPLVLGHEVSGYRIDGGQSTPVVVNPLVTCGYCPACERGEENLCPTRQIISMPPRPGAFSELFSIPERNVIELPETIDLQKAALAEPIACGWHAVRLVERMSGYSIGEQRVVVIGAGAVGLGTALSCRALGVEPFKVVENNPGRRQTAIAAGFDCIDSTEAGTGIEGHVDAVIDAVGMRPTRTLASQILRPGGTLVHIGLGDADAGIDIRRMTLQELRVSGSYTYTMRDFRETVGAMIDGRLGHLNWFEEAPLDQGLDCFERLSEGRVGVPKILLTPNT